MAVRSLFTPAHVTPFQFQTFQCLHPAKSLTWLSHNNRFLSFVDQINQEKWREKLPTNNSCPTHSTIPEQPVTIKDVCHCCVAFCLFSQLNFHVWSMYSLSRQKHASLTEWMPHFFGINLQSRNVCDTCKGLITRKSDFFCKYSQ